MVATSFDLTEMRQHFEADLQESTDLFRPGPQFRELDGAIYWPELTRIMYVSYPNTRSWLCDKWLNVSLRTKCERVVSDVFSNALATEWRKNDKSQTMGIQYLETDSQTKNESQRRLNGPQMEEYEITDDGQ